MKLGASRLFSSAAYLFGASILQRAAAIGLIFFAVGQLSASEFGSLTYIYATATSLSAFLADTFSSAALKYLQQPAERFRSVANRREASDLFWAALMGACVISVVVFTVSGFTTNTESLAHSFPAAIIALLVVLNGTLFALFSRNGAMKIGASASISGSVVIIAIAFFFRDNPSSSFYLWVVAFGLLITTSCYFFSSRVFNILQISTILFSFPTIRHERFQFLWKTALALALGGPVHWACLSMLHSTEGGVLQIAIFSAWFQWYLLITFIPSTLVYFTLPWLAKGYRLGSKVFSHRILLILSAFALFGLAVFFLILTNDDHVLSIYKQDYHGSRTELLLSVSGGIVAGLVTLSSHAYLASGRVTGNLIITCFYSVSYLSITFLLANSMNLGALGLFLAILVSASLQLLAQLAILFRQRPSVQRYELSI